MDRVYSGALCGNYGFQLRQDDSETNVCHQLHIYTSDLNPGDKMTIALWHTLNAGHQGLCYFWCSPKVGQLPPAKFDPMVNEELVEKLVSYITITSIFITEN